MKSEKSQQIANEFAKGLKGFVNEALYVGIIDGEPVRLMRSGPSGRSTPTSQAAWSGSSSNARSATRMTAISPPQS